jgi:hypothetical protein
MVAVTAGAVSQTTGGWLARDAAVISQIAWLVWAYGEISHGANWLRRLFGVGGAAYAIAGLASQRVAE